MVKLVRSMFGSHSELCQTGIGSRDREGMGTDQFTFQGLKLQFEGDAYKQ